MKNSKNKTAKSSEPTIKELDIESSIAGGNFSLDSKNPAYIINLPVYKLSELIHKGELSSFEVVSAFIKRIEEVNPSLNAVVAFRPKEALEEAIEADMELKKGNSKGVLHGIPCTIKDSFDVEGIISTGGTLGRSQFIPTKNATIVQRLKDAGAIIMGMTNTPEFTMSYFTENFVYGRTNNPYDLNRSPGGSTGGAAAIIAAGGSPFDIGTDSGGSIRYPAHCCGIVGLKPTSGRVPRTGHIVDYQGLAQSLSHVGPLAKCVEDLSLLFNIISGEDNIDPYIYPVPIFDYKKVEVKKLRAAYYIDNGLCKPSEDTFITIQKINSIIAKSGISIKEDLPTGVKEETKISDGLSIYADYLSSGGEFQRMLEKYGTSKSSITWIDSIKHPTIDNYSMLVERIDNLRSEMLSFWKNNDVLICPVNPMPAPLWASKSDINLTKGAYFSYTSFFNTLGWPSVVIRGGTSTEGLPIGVQIVAAPWREDYCLAMAKFLETELGVFEDGLVIKKFK